MIFHVSNLNTRVLDPPTHLHEFDANWEDSICEWPLKQTGLVFAKYLNFFMNWMVCSGCYLGCMVVNINALFGEWRITEHDYFQILLLGILSGIGTHLLFIFRYRCCDDHFPWFCKYIFPQLQTCSADCAEGFFSSNIRSNF